MMLVMMLVFVVISCRKYHQEVACEAVGGKMTRYDGCVQGR